MTLLLKLALTVLFFFFAIVSFFYPESIKEYIDIRFRGLYRFALANSAISSYISRNAAQKIPLTSYKAIAAFLAMGGIAILLERQMVILSFAYTVMVIGGALHMPYNTHYLREHTSSQIKRLICVFAVFSGLLYLANSQQSVSEIPQGI